MKYALYGFVAAALVAMSGGCASKCCGPIQGSIFGGGCTSSCDGSALNTLFGGTGCTATAADGCASEYVAAPIVNGGRWMAGAANGAFVDAGASNQAPIGAGGGLLTELGLIGGGCGPGGCPGAGGGAMGHLLNVPQHLKNGCINGNCGQVMGPTAGMVQYPYYTTRGPRDFFLNNPPSIGP